MKEVITKMKFGPSRATAYELGSFLAEPLPYLEIDEAVVTYIPTTPARIRERGFDQAHILAREVARRKGLKVTSLLIRRRSLRQVGSTRKERIAHAENMFEAKSSYLIEGRTIILVDDVVTTAATIDSAGRVLKEAGASRVLALVCSRA